MSSDEPARQDAPTEDVAVRMPEIASYESVPVEGDDWLDEAEELPRRPRRRLFSPVSLAMLGVLVTACGFIGGVLVEKGQTSSGSSSGAAPASLSSRFAGLRGGASAGSSTAGGSGGPSAASGARGRPVAGQVAYLRGKTLYVTTAEGNTIRVTTSAGTNVTKTVKAPVDGIHPGETVTVTGTTGANDTIAAESISAGAGGALGALFGGSSPGTGTPQSGGAGGGEPSLFGKGG